MVWSIKKKSSSSCSSLLVLQAPCWMLITKYWEFCFVRFDINQQKCFQFRVSPCTSQSQQTKQAWIEIALVFYLHFSFDAIVPNAHAGYIASLTDISSLKFCLLIILLSVWIGWFILFYFLFFSINSKQRWTMSLTSGSSRKIPLVLVCYTVIHNLYFYACLICCIEIVLILCRFNNAPL